MSSTFSPPILRPSLAETITGPWTFTSGFRTTFEIIDVKALGATGDGIADDSTAFATLRDRVIASAVADPDTGRKVLRAIPYIPPGRYLITVPEALMSTTATPTDVFSGYHLSGAGKEVVKLVFTPAAAGALMKNNDQFARATFSGITFVGGNVNATCVNSISQGQASQNWTWHDCDWRGTWADVITLAGSATADNNSEWTFYNPNITGVVCTSWFRVGSGAGGAAQDQFVNYTFINPTLNPTSGDIFRLDYGGCLNVYGGSMIIGGAAGGRNFYMPNGTHSNGATRLNVDGVRFEVRNANVKLIDCSWKHGNVMFKNCDMGSASSGVCPLAQVVATFYGSADEGAIVVFDSCFLVGSHEYKFDDNTWNSDARATYRATKHIQASDANDFLVFTAVAGATNIGGRPEVRFEDCKAGGVAYGGTNQERLFDCTINFGTRRDAQAVKRVVNMRGRVDAFPWSGGSTARSVMLPKGAIITDITVIKPAGGAQVNTNWTLNLVDDDSTVLFTYAPAVAWNGAWQSSAAAVTLPRLCDTDNKRHLTLTQTNIAEASTTGLFLVEYIV